MPDENMLGAYEKYMARLHRLIALIAAGRDDRRGDDLRDEMNLLWDRLTNEERELVEADADKLASDVGAPPRSVHVRKE